MGRSDRRAGRPGHRRPFSLIVWRARALAPCMPCGTAAAAAAAEAFAGLGDSEGLRQAVDADVCGAATIRACCGDGSNAVLAHVGESLAGRAWSVCQARRLLELSFNFCDRDAFDVGVLDCVER